MIPRPPHLEHLPMEFHIPQKLVLTTLITLKIYLPILVITPKWPPYPHFQS
jgi:hypothetical protein